MNEDSKIIWTEKYRPKTLDQIELPDSTKNLLENCIKNKDIPHLLFFGAQGTGKTSTTQILITHLFGDRKERYKEFNGSSERTLSVVQKDFKNFINSSFINEIGIPSFKVIILDEAESMTNDAQTALNRIMEVSSNIVRFIIICNNVEKIILPIRSRCSENFFQPVSVEKIIHKLNYICEREKIFINKILIEKLAILSEGDLRSSITILHAIKNGFKESITMDKLLYLHGFIPENVIENIIKTVILNKNYEETLLLIDILNHQGYSLSQLTSQIYDCLINLTNIDNEKKSKIINILARYDRISKGDIEEDIHKTALLSEFFLID